MASVIAVVQVAAVLTAAILVSIGLFAAKRIQPERALPSKRESSALAAEV